MKAVVAALRARGIEVSRAFMQDQELFAGRQIEALMAATLVCADEVDFRQRLRDAA